MSKSIFFWNLRFFATLVVPNYLFTININNVLNYIYISIIYLYYLKIFLLCGPHLHACGPQSFLSRAAFRSKKLRARGPQFADPSSRTRLDSLLLITGQFSQKKIARRPQYLEKKRWGPQLLQNDCSNY